MGKKRKVAVGPGAVICGLLVLYGAFFLCIGGYRVYNSYASLQWPVVKGKVIGSGVSVHKDDDGWLLYTPEVTYTYAVGSNTYVGSRIRFAPIKTSEPKAMAVAGNYARGVTVGVYYNPADPVTSVLEPGVRPNTWPFAIIGAILISAVVIVFRLYSNVKRNAAKGQGVNSQGNK